MSMKIVDVTIEVPPSEICIHNLECWRTHHLVNFKFQVEGFSTELTKEQIIDEFKEALERFQYRVEQGVSDF